MLRAQCFLINDMACAKKIVVEYMIMRALSLGRDCCGCCFLFLLGVVLILVFVFLSVDVGVCYLLLL